MWERCKAWLKGPVGTPDAPTLQELKERLHYMRFERSGVHVDVAAYLATPRGQKAWRDAIPDSLLTAEQRKARALERLSDAREGPERG